VRLRAPTADDAAPIADFLNEHALAVHGESDIDVDEVRHWFMFDNLWLRVAERAGRIVGYVDAAADGGEPARWDIDARALEADVATGLVAAAEEHALASAAERPLKLRGFVAASHDVDCAAFAARGFAPIRSSFQMRIDLDGAPPPPEWPGGVSGRAMREGEEQRLYEAHQESFEDHWGYRRTPKEEWRRFLRDAPRFDPTLWFVAEDGDEVAGVALCAWHHSGDPRFGWINVLGVRRPWRKRGLGLALLLHAFAEFERRGASRVGLGVDAENTTGAVRLYERAGMSVARRSDTYEKIL
jgi:mycothiol synthase